MSYKLILVKSEPGWEDGDDSTMHVAPIESISELWQHADQREWQLRQDMLNLLRHVLRLDDQDVRDVVAGAGFVNTNEVEDREKKLALEKKFFLLSPIPGTGLAGPCRRIDPSHITRNEAANLAQGGDVVQAVSKNTLKSLMSPEALKTYNQALKRYKEMQAKRKAAIEKRREAKKQKEIEKARKVLEAAGEK